MLENNLNHFRIESVLNSLYAFVADALIQDVPKRLGHLNILENINFTKKCFLDKSLVKV